MQTNSVGSRNERILQCMMLLQAVHPGLQLRIILHHVFHGPLQILSPVFRPQGIIQHVETSPRKRTDQGEQYNAGDGENFLFHSWRFQISHEPKACSNNISSPFFTTAP